MVSNVYLDCKGVLFVLSRTEASAMKMIANMIEDDEPNVDTVVPLNSETITPQAMDKIVSFIHHHHSQSRRNPHTYPDISTSRPPIITSNKLSDYISSWDCNWVISMDLPLLQEVIEVCHMLHYDAAKFVCLYRLVLLCVY